MSSNSSETIFENIHMAILAKKHLKDFIREQYKHSTIPFCVISDEKRVGKYLEIMQNNGSAVIEDEPQVIVLVLDFEKRKSIIH
jgi:2C-methyl-D-erythritol 2,4-cyclodiphosphate synthase